MNAIKAVEGKQMLAKFPLNYDIMMPVSRDYLEIWFEHINILIFYFYFHLVGRYS